MRNTPQAAHRARRARLADFPADFLPASVATLVLSEGPPGSPSLQDRWTRETFHGQQTLLKSREMPAWLTCLIQTPPLCKGVSDPKTVILEGVHPEWMMGSLSPIPFPVHIVQRLPEALRPPAVRTALHATDWTQRLDAQANERA